MSLADRTKRELTEQEELVEGRIVIEGAAPFWDKEKIVYRPLYPELTANSVLAWKKQQLFTLAADRFIEHLKYFLH